MSLWSICVNPSNTLWGPKSSKFLFPLPPFPSFPLSPHSSPFLRYLLLLSASWNPATSPGKRRKSSSQLLCCILSFSRGLYWKFYFFSRNFHKGSSHWGPSRPKFCEGPSRDRRPYILCRARQRRQSYLVTFTGLLARPVKTTLASYWKPETTFRRYTCT